jgi:catechol 2,3-dioxygenase-like lactoylglutathione lyase family enzyme
VRPQPLIAVNDVEAASLWYQQLLGCKSAHGGPYYERLERDGELLLQLHHWNDGGHDDHPNLDRPDAARPGRGVLLWFKTAAFDAAVARARALGAEIVEDVHVNRNSRGRELWLRDLDGYIVVLAGPDGEI